MPLFIRRSFLILYFALCFSIIAAQSNFARAATIQLAQNGKALLPIVISPNASDETKAVASQLADYLKQISGADFSIQTGDGKSGIVLGTIAQFPHPELDDALKINGVDGREAFAIRTSAEKVLLLGATDLAARHVAYRFLETLGVRWFFPAAEWTVVPSIPDLKFDSNLTERPVFL
ncbi:MAG: hypothetical protein ABI210_06160, partial [Abditibacteriaceae bacterium]